MRTGGIVLCGGKSLRMGAAKAMLPFGDEVMLTRVIRLLAEAVSPIVVVAAPDQLLPPLPGEIELVHDRAPGRGPLEGLYGGLHALGDRVEAVYATGCDVPLLRPDFVRVLVGLLEGHEVVVPKEGAFFHPLAAVYRCCLAKRIRQMLDLGKRRPVELYQQVATRSVDIQQLRAVDPELLSLMNVNQPDDYQRALRLAGFQ